MFVYFQSDPPDSPATDDEVFGWLASLGIVLLGAWAIYSAFEENRKKDARRVSLFAKEDVSLRDDWRCTYCGKRVNRRTRHIDHSRSVANGGTSHLNNLRLACSTCNLSKGALNAREFR